MPTLPIRRLGAVALCTLAATAAQAQGRGRGGHEGHKDRDRYQDEGRHVGAVPPGLAKKGGLPPGQARKRYRADDGVAALRDVFGRSGYTVVRTTEAGDARYVYYRDADGRVRRAVVRPGAEQLQFANVPRGLLDQVLARLY